MSSASTTALLRPALEAAMSVARSGEREQPPVPAPAMLRRYLSFARLPDPALDVARRALDDVPEFRARVAAAVTEDAVGRAGWVFLTRPEGWRSELDAIRKAAAAEELEAKDSRAESSAQRRLAGTEAALARSQQSALAASDEAVRLRSERDTAVVANQGLADEVRRLQAEVERLAGERTEVIRRLKETEQAAQDHRAAARSLRHELRMLQAELSQVVDPTTGAPAPAGSAAEVETDDADAGASAAGPAPGVEAGPAVDVDALSDLLRQALGLLGAEVVDAVAAPSEGSSGRTSEQPSGAPGSASGRPSAARRTGRRPAPLPGGVLDDSVEAADLLVRRPGALVLVDGYNVTNDAWHDLPLGDQRDRLLAACAELHTRCGAEIEIVFDGVEGVPAHRTLARSDVRYWFTDVGVDADDELLARVAAEPDERVVVVASSDKRVADGAREKGANVLPTRAFLGALRR